MATSCKALAQRAKHATKLWKAADLEQQRANRRVRRLAEYVEKKLGRHGSGRAVETPAHLLKSYKISAAAAEKASIKATNAWHSMNNAMSAAAYCRRR